MQRPKSRGQQDQKAENYNAMIAIIAEKPSVARDIAGFLGANQKEEGVLSGNGYCVTWALGHLVSLALPEDYEDIAKGTLPILPDPFRLTIRKIKEGLCYVTDPRARRQLEIIASVFQRCESIIAATDAGREGELIFRYIYEYLNCKKPFQRLWISSLTITSIRRGMENLRRADEFEGLYNAARARSRADWLIGMNASQALSISCDATYSLGRVQTPTLAMICRRYKEHIAFTSEKYWQIKLQHQVEFIDFSSSSMESWYQKKEVNDVLAAITRDATAYVAGIAPSISTEQPPLLFDLAALQKEANAKLNLSAEQTLSVAQALYEKKFITYPRTASRFVTEDLWAEIPSLISALHENPKFTKATEKLKWGRLSRRVVNDLKVTDHHAVIVTGKIPTALPSVENAVYDMIAYRMLEALSSPCVKEVTSVSLDAAGHRFVVKGVRIKEAGWRSIKGGFSDDCVEIPQELPDLKEGDIVKIKNTYINEMETKPPALYTDGSLLGAMENAGRELEMQHERQILKGVGIGTPATRSATIELLIERHYIRRQNKTLLPMPKGLKVVDMVGEMKISDVGMTAQWELSLDAIANGLEDMESFQKDIESYTDTLTKEILSIASTQDQLPSLECPKCRNAQLVMRENLIKCSDSGCGWVQFRNVCGHFLESAEIIELIHHGRTPLLRGMVSRSGKKFDAKLVLSDDGKIIFEFDNRKK